MSQINIPTQRLCIKRIAFRTGRGLGDAILCEPLVRAIAHKYPQAEITVVLPRCCAGIDALCFEGQHFVPWQEDDAFYVFAKDFDLVIDADPAQYAGPFHQTGSGGEDIVRLFAHYRPEALETTAYERMAEGLARLGIDALAETPTLHLTQKISDADWAKLTDLHLRPDVPTFVLHPGSSALYAFKRWGWQGFAFVADQLAERYQANVVLVGSSGERELIETLVASMTHQAQTSVAMDWSICQLAALLDQATLFLGNDSGVGHLAAALSRPTVTVAGPTSARFWAPLTDRALVTDPRGCCYDPGACGVQCLKSIQGDEVLGAVEALLTATTKRAGFSCLDPICAAEDLAVTELGEDAIVLCSRRSNMPMTVQRGKHYVLRVLQAVEDLGSFQQVCAAFPDADLLLEQCFRHAIVLPHITQGELTSCHLSRKTAELIR